MRRRLGYGGRADTELALVVDCADLDRADAFWCAVLGYVSPWPSSNQYRALRPADGDGIELLLQQVPEVKRAKNRMHLDLRVRELDTEVDRVVALGAQRLSAEPVAEHGWTWHVLADPDGNEFCVLQPPAAHWDD
jgi:predicted enzyme related to lactoylglutathione lyase